MAYDETNVNQKWNYEQVTILEGLHQVWFKTKEERYLNFIKDNIDQYISEDGTIRTYKYGDFNLDNINPGMQLLFLYEQTKAEKYKIAAGTLRKQIENQPRTKACGFWHKKIYPFQMWLDGLYMASPFYAGYIQMFNDSKDYSDITRQIITVYNQTLDSKPGLLFHAWDESKEQKWSDPETGHAPHIFAALELEKAGLLKVN